jgi:hypothetical protein
MREGGDLQRTAPQGRDDGIGRGRSGGNLGVAQPHDRAARPDSRRGQYEAQALARRREIVVGDPGREVEKRRGDERRLVHDLDHVLERDAVDRLRGPGHDSHRAPPSERHDHADAAGRQRQRVGHPVREAREHRER